MRRLTRRRKGGRLAWRALRGGFHLRFLWLRDVSCLIVDTLKCADGEASKREKKNEIQCERS